MMWCPVGWFLVADLRMSHNLCESLKLQLRSHISMADEEIVDPKKVIEDTVCKPKCVRPLLAYQECVQRIKDDKEGHKHCTGQYFDYWACVDKCAAPRTFAKLK